MRRGVFYELTSVVGGAKTSVVVDSIHAGCSVLTVMVFTVVSVGLTGRPLKAQRTLTALTEYNQDIHLFPELLDLQDFQAHLPHMYAPSSSSSTRQVPPLAQG